MSNESTGERAMSDDEATVREVLVERVWGSQVAVAEQVRALDALDHLVAELRTLQGENERLAAEVERWHGEHDKMLLEAAGNAGSRDALRTALDDARGALEEALDWIPDSLPGVRGRLLAILKPSPMNEEPDES